MNRFVAMLTGVIFMALSGTAFADGEGGLGGGRGKKRARGVGLTHRAKVMKKQGGKALRNKKRMTKRTYKSRDKGGARTAKGRHHAIRAKQARDKMQRAQKKGRKQWNKTPRAPRRKMTDKEMLDAVDPAK